MAIRRQLFKTEEEFSKKIITSHHLLEAKVRKSLPSILKFSLEFSLVVSCFLSVPFLAVIVSCKFLHCFCQEKETNELLLQTEQLQQHIEELNSTHNEQLLQDNSNEIAEQKAHMEKLEKNLEEKESVLAQKNNELIELKQQVLQMSQQRELREKGDVVNVSKHIKILFTSN